MSKRRLKIDPNQLALDFDKIIDEFINVRERVFDTIEQNPAVVPVENEFDLCNEIAVVVDRCRKAKGFSRDQLVDLINDYFGRSEKTAQTSPPGTRKPLTLNMLNHYLSKSAEYPMPAYLLVAITHVLESLEPLQVLADPEGAKVISGQEVKHVQLGKLEDVMAEMRRLKKEIKGS